MDVNDAKGLKYLLEENAKLKGGGGPHAWIT